MSCQMCESKRVLSIQAHSRDLTCLTLNEVEHSGYMLEMENLGAGDDVYLEVCLDCGQVQGKWPIETPRELERETTNAQGL